MGLNVLLHLLVALLLLNPIEGNLLLSTWKYLYLHSKENQKYQDET